MLLMCLDDVLVVWCSFCALLFFFLSMLRFYFSGFGFFKCCFMVKKISLFVRLANKQCIDSLILKMSTLMVKAIHWDFSLCLWCLTSELELVSSRKIIIIFFLHYVKVYLFLAAYLETSVCWLWLLGGHKMLIRSMCNQSFIIIALSLLFSYPLLVYEFNIGFVIRSSINHDCTLIWHNFKVLWNCYYLLIYWSQT